MSIFSIFRLKKGATMTLRRRLDRLKLAHPERCEIEVYLHDYGGDLVTGPNGERMTTAEAERRQQGAALVIDLRREHEPR